MNAERDIRYLTYIKKSIELIELRTFGIEFAAFERDIDRQDAILWRLETLAEATGRLSDEVKQRHPEVRWRAIYGFRNIAAHGYLELNLDVVWEIVKVHLPKLNEVATEELTRLSGM